MISRAKLRGTTAAENIANLIHQQGGWISFATWMSAALYDPEFGYYTSRIRNVGRTGDFTTASGLDSILGHALAAWIRDRRKILPKRSGYHVIELGGGNGTLAATIQMKLGWFFRRGLTYHLVEVSPTLRALQQKQLRSRRVLWHESVEDALAAAQGNALIFSNELVDATPCRRLVRQKNQWSEMGLSNGPDGLREVLRPMSEDECAELNSSVFSLPADERTQTVEVHAAYRAELQKLAVHWKCGSLLTIDYGDRFRALYHRQPQGTMRGYFHHLRIDGPEIYTRPGHQDVTADVNFTDLENWGNQCGLSAMKLESQRDFLLRWLGPLQPRNTHDARLLDPTGAGKAFKVLEQHPSSAAK